MNNQQTSRELHEMLILRYEPIAIKLIKNEDEVPGNAIRPLRDMKKHLALCQTFALTRRDKKTIYMDKLDHWCWNPLIGLGHVDCSVGTEQFEVVCQVLGMGDVESAREFFAKFPRLPLDEYIGIVSAPLETAEFVPDIVLIYCNNAQLRSLVWAAKLKMGRLVETELDAIDSCVWATVPSILSGEYRVTLPDIGEYERAMAGEDEIIFSVPGWRIDEIMDGLRSFYNMRAGYSHHQRDMLYDFPRPEFYKTLFEMWGLDHHGEVWDR
ncbi:MAG: DUF169 domain-containing protein [Oscillospiraceae bacterium]|nr:DUF169 domain-containing protein [Oscillospiraceae bacterium]